MSLWLIVFRMVPKNLMSVFTGFLTRLNLPQILQRPLITAFARTYGIDMSEAEFELSSYATIEDLFTRKLKPGLRTASGAFVSPADGLLVRAGEVSGTDAIQVKDWRYCLEELVSGRAQKRQGRYKFYATVYLAPHNYHRVHAPCSGRLVQIRYIPGRLWPVNDRFVNLVPALFVENERLVFEFALEGGGTVWAVMVGALNVGRVTTPFVPNFHSNAFRRRPVTRDLLSGQQFDVRAGDEIGTFMLGSTVVLVLDDVAYAKLKPARVDQSKSVKMGEGLSLAKEQL